jgi:hypothetical protein
MRNSHFVQRVRLALAVVSYTIDNQVEDHALAKSGQRKRGHDLIGYLFGRAGAIRIDAERVIDELCCDVV